MEHDDIGVKIKGLLLSWGQDEKGMVITPVSAGKLVLVFVCLK